jgi:hypothetical protein
MLRINRVKERAMHRSLALTLLICAIATGVDAQATPQSWGTSAETTLWVGSYAFIPLEPTATWTYGSGGSRYSTNMDALWLAPISLPHGALLTGLDVIACDSTATGQIQWGLGRQTISGGTEFFGAPFGFFGTGGPQTPGCGLISGSFGPFPIDAVDAAHYVAIQQIGTTGEARFHAVGVRYKLQVSPAPASATFGDVPTDHPFFRFVEALAASGITAGCGGGNFCPNDPITRGQMAVFLAAALGLHFPN